VPEFLSREWVAALDDAARTSAAFTDVAEERFVLEQRVTFADGTEVRHHLVVSPDGARAIAGPAPDADIVLMVDYVTARDLARGATNAQRALAAGRLRVGGRIETLAHHGDALLALDDVFAAVRTTTTFPGDAGRR